AAPRDRRVDDAADHLAHRRLAFRRREPAAEVLLGDDVRRGLRPELRKLDAALLERRARFARDQRVPHLPLDLVEGVAAGDGEEAPDAEPGAPVDDRVHDLSGRRAGPDLLLYARHFFPFIVVSTRTSTPSGGPAE